MYSNLVKYVPDRKPPMGAVLNPYLPINRGLVLDSIMWEGSGNIVADLSGNGNTGVFNGTPTWVSGDKGSAINFPGSADFINCGDKLSLNITGEITVVLSFKPTNASSNRTVLGKRGKESYWLLTFENKLQFWTGNIASFSSALLFDNTRVQVAIVRNDVKDETSFYFDGVYDTANADGGAMMSSSGFDLYIGVDPRDEVGLDFVGDIDYVMIYNRALSASEVAKLYREPFCGFRWPNIIELASYVAAAPSGIPIFRRRRAG